MHEISKVLAPLLDPRTLAFAVLVIGAGLLWTRARSAGRIFVSMAVAASLVLGVVPVGAVLFSILEGRFPPAPLSDRVDGIIMVGGEVSPVIYAERGYFSGIGSGARLLAFLALARQYPAARLVFSGGPGRLEERSTTEAGAVRDLLEQAGLEVSRLILESESRTTRENAALSLRLADPSAGERWVVVTSAIHMPRTIGSFRGAGWEDEGRRLYPYPVDFRSSPGFRPGMPTHFHAGLDVLARAMYECAALLAYYNAGWTDALFPAPH